MSSKLKILMAMRPNALSERGGDTIVMEKVTEGLLARGHQVYCDLEGLADPKDYDLVQLFNFCQPDVLQSLAEKCVEAKKPYLATCMYEDWTAYFSQMMSITQALGNYIVSAQPSEHWPELERHAARAAPVKMQDNTFTAMYAEALIASGEYEALTLRHDYPFTARVRQYHCGSEIVDEVDDGSLFIEETGIRDFVLCVGRLESRKNQLMLLKALEHSELPLVFLTGGVSSQKQYEELCRSFKRKGETHFIGRLKKEVLASAYVAARVHAMPSWQELPGIVSLEAARYGTQVVATEYGTISDYLGEDAFYCLPGSADSIKNAIEQAFEAPRKPSLCERAKEFTWDRTASEHEAIYEEVLDLHPSYGWAAGTGGLRQSAIKTEQGEDDILFVSSCGNHSRLLTRIAKLLISRGHRVSFLSLDSFFGEGASEIIRDQGFPALELESGFCRGQYFSKLLSRGLYNLEASQAVARFFANRRPKAVVLAHDQPALESLIIRAAERVSAITVKIQHGALNALPLREDGTATPFCSGDSGLGLTCIWGERLAKELRERTAARRFRITGSPRFDVLKDWPGYCRKSETVRVLLATQNFAKHGKLTEDNELKMYRIIIGHLLCRENVLLTLRLHPAQTQVPSYQEMADEFGSRVIIDSSGDSLDILKNFDAVLAVSSTITTESMLMGIPTYPLEYFLAQDGLYAISRHESFIEATSRPDFPQEGVFGCNDVQVRKRELVRDVDGIATARIASAIEEELAAAERAASEITSEVKASVIVELSAGDSLGAVASVLRPSEISYEVVVVDRSHLGVNFEQEERLTRDRRFRYFHCPGISPLEAFTFAVEEAKGGVLIRLHADCTANPGWVEGHLERLLKAPSAKLSLSIVSERDVLGIVHQVLSLPSFLSKEALLNNDNFAHLTKNFAFRADSASLLLNVSSANREFASEFVAEVLETCTDVNRQVVRGGPASCSSYPPALAGRAVLESFQTGISKTELPSLSIVINGVGGAEQILSIVKEVVEQAGECGELQVLLVNNAGGSQLREVLRPILEPRHWLYFESGIPARCADVFNQAVGLATNELCVFLDGSSLPSRGFFSSLCTRFRERSRDALALSCSVSHPGVAGGSVFASAVERALLYSGHPRCSADELNPFTLAIGDGLCVPRMVFTDLGLRFNINYSTIWAQNLEFAFQLWREGFRFAFVPLHGLLKFQDVEMIHLRREVLERAGDALRLVRDHPLLCSEVLGVSVLTEKSVELWTERANVSADDLKQLEEQLVELQQMKPASLSSKEAFGEISDEVAMALRQWAEVIHYKEVLRIVTEG